MLKEQFAEFGGRPLANMISAFYLLEGHIKACLSVNRSAELTSAQGLIAAGSIVDTRQLADEGLDLAQLGPMFSQHRAHPARHARRYRRP
jgi:hypothetical protein